MEVKVLLPMITFQPHIYSQACRLVNHTHYITKRVEAGSDKPLGCKSASYLSKYIMGLYIFFRIRSPYSILISKCSSHHGQPTLHTGCYTIETSFLKLKWLEGLGKQLRQHKLAAQCYHNI